MNTSNSPECDFTSLSLVDQCNQRLVDNFNDCHRESQLPFILSRASGHHVVIPDV